MQIRTLQEHELTRCVELQHEVWQFSARDLVTEEMLRLSERSGGIVLGAFSEQRLVGFVFSFPVRIPGHRLIQHSHMLAVVRSFRDTGIGNQLKWAQYQRAAASNCSRVTWTFDPLESRNAHLNLNKLGVTVKHYYVNLYGEGTSSVLHQGLGTDRFLAEWTIPGASSRPSMRFSLDEISRIPQAITTATRESARVPTDVSLDHVTSSGSAVAVEIPRRIQRVKEKDPGAGRAWREATREAFLHYLKSMTVTGLYSTKNSEPRSFYRLESTASLSESHSGGTS